MDFSPGSARSSWWKPRGSSVQASTGRSRTSALAPLRPRWRASRSSRQCRNCKAELRMEIGLTGSFGTLGPQVPEVARAIEAAGFESFWAGEHIIVPVEIADPYRRGVLLPEMYRH